MNYFGARYLDPMLGLWTSVDAARQFASPYLYAGNGMNPIGAIDPDGNETTVSVDENNMITNMSYNFNDNNMVTFAFADKTYMLAAEPPIDSYFYSLNENGEYAIVGKIFDMEMSYKVDDMIRDVLHTSRLDYELWGSFKPFDFKSRAYGAENNHLTVGILNGTAMTARDAGNAVWGGWFRVGYFDVPVLGNYAMNRISDYYACKQAAHKYGGSLKNAYMGGVREDRSSAVMQNWGYKNYIQPILLNNR